VVGTDEPGEYVVKFRGAGQGVKALIAELLAVELAGVLRLPVPQRALIDLDRGFGQSEPDPEIQDILRGSVGTNFGLAYLPGALAFDPAADRAIITPDLAADIVWFDALITNVDRTPRNTNMLLQHDRLFLIDHGASLYFHHLPQEWGRNARSRFPHIRDHVLLPFAGDIAVAGTRLAPLLTEEALRAVVATIPDEWLSGEERFADVAAHREAYVQYFLTRLAAPRPFEEEASDAAARNMV
jgi:hypothetical protein